MSDVIEARELGKLAPYLRYKGCLLCRKQVSITRALRLFNKNTRDRKSERMCMVAESCPVTVSENLVQGEEGPLNGGGNHDPLKVA